MQIERDDEDVKPAQNDKLNETAAPSTTYIEQNISLQIQGNAIQTATKWDVIDRDSDIE